MHESLDPDGRLLPFTPGIVSRPFAEWSLFNEIVLLDESFEGDLRIGRDGDAGAWHFQGSHRFSEDTADRVVFANPLWDFQTGDHQQGRMHAGYDGDRAWLTSAMILVHNQAAMPAWRHHYRGSLRPVGLHPVGTVIHPTRVRVFHHHHASGADERAAIMFVPGRRWDRSDVNGIALDHIFMQRACGHDLRRAFWRVFHIVSPPQH